VTDLRGRIDTQARDLDRVQSAYAGAVDEVHSLRDRTQKHQTSIRQLGEQFAQLREIYNLSTALPTGAVTAATQT